MASVRNDLRPYSLSEWRTAAILFGGYVILYQVTATFVPSGIPLYPASAAALAGLFFGGQRLWPVVFAAAFLCGAVNHLPLSSLLALSSAETLQSFFGAHFLRGLRLDPLFRRYQDTFHFLATALGISLVVPTLSAVLAYAGGAEPTLLFWWQSVVGMAASLVLVAPSFLRWFAKPRFSRTRIEWLETLFIFALLGAIDAAVFFFSAPDIVGIPVSYFLLVPLFWIALRMRPRFLSLALLITSLFAVASALINPDGTSLLGRLYNIEVLLITIAMAFYTIVSLEEDRRVHMNLMRSQLATLENAIARITSESNAKNDFIAILAHELRNPLAPIKSGIDLLKLRDDCDDEMEATLNVMDERMETIRRLLDDLLDISRIAEGKIALKRTAQELEPIIRRALISTEHYIKERHQSLVLKLPRGRNRVLADPVRLEQVFSNLITNASKYSPSGDTISLSVKHDGAWIDARISDHGIGIDSGDLEAIFTPFHQTAEAGRGKKGLGIGLALVRSFVEMHGGTVVAESKGRNKGSTFIVRLPLHESPTEPHHPQPSERELPARARGTSVLVVDDNDAAAAGIGRLLELSGCHVQYAYDGRQAIDSILDHSPAIVFLDVGLPDQDGYAVAKEVRERGYEGTLVALTGFSTHEARERGREAGFDEYLVKPVGVSDLRRAIASHG